MVLAVMSQPARARASTTSGWPWEQAKWKAVIISPLGSAVSRSAPRSINSFTIAVWPWEAANIIGVWPRLDILPGLAFRSSSRAATST